MRKERKSILPKILSPTLSKPHLSAALPVIIFLIKIPDTNESPETLTYKYIFKEIDDYYKENPCNIVSAHIHLYTLFPKEKEFYFFHFTFEDNKANKTFT